MPSLVWIVLPCVIAQTPAAKPGKLFTSKSGGYSIALPAGVVQKKRVANLGGGEVSFRIDSYQRRVMLRSVAWGDLPAEPADATSMLEAARDDVLKQVKGKVGEDRPVESNGRAGREFSFEVPRQVTAGGAVGRARVFLDGRRVFEVVAVNPAPSASDLPAFLGSFRIAGEPTAAVAKRSEAPTGSGPYESRTWGYRVRFPGRPKIEDHLEKDEILAGRHTATFGQSPRAYVVIAGRATQPLSYTAAIDAIMGAKVGGIRKGKLLSTRDVTSGNLLGKEFSAEVEEPPLPPGVFKKFRVFATGAIIYNVAYFDFGPTPDRDAGNAFLDSFELLNPEPYLAERFELRAPWKAVTLPGETGTIMFPGTPEPVPLPKIRLMGEFKIDSLGMDHGAYRFGVVSVIPPESKRNPTDEAVESVGRDFLGIKEAPRSKKAVVIDGRPGQRYLYRVPIKSPVEGLDLVVRLVIIPAGARFYFLYAFSPSGFEYIPVVEGFFQSLHGQK